MDNLWKNPICVVLAQQKGVPCCINTTVSGGVGGDPSERPEEKQGPEDDDRAQL